MFVQETHKAIAARMGETEIDAHPPPPSPSNKKPKSSDPAVLSQDWPLALHLLGHMYNHSL